jgi:hypothetical protein
MTTVPGCPESPASRTAHPIAELASAQLTRDLDRKPLLW